MPNLVALGLMVSDKKIFKVFNFFSVLLPWQPQFLTESNFFKKFWRGPWQEHFCEISSKSNKWFQRRRCLKKKLMHRRMDGRMTDNGPWHKLAGLWPVELKIASNKHYPVTFFCELKTNNFGNSKINQGVWSSSNVCESRRFMKNHIQVYVPKCSQNVRKPSTKFVRIIHSRYFHKHIDHI